MAYDPRNVKYPSEVHQHHPPPGIGYPYAVHRAQTTDENRNENNCGNKESRQSSGTQTIQKVDAATMTDPLQIDFRLTSEYLARCSSTLGLPYVSKCEENSNASSQNCQEVRPKMEYNIVPQHINGKNFVSSFFKLRYFIRIYFLILLLTGCCSFPALHPSYNLWPKTNFQTRIYVILVAHHFWLKNLIFFVNT